MRILKVSWSLLKESFREWRSDNVMHHGAALSFYTVFSLAPLLIIVIAIAGLAFGPDAARGRIVEQFGHLVGQQAADQIQTMVQNAWQPKKGLIAGAIGVVTLILGAMGVFGALKQALNTVWAVKPKEVHGIWGLLRDRVLSLAMIVGIAFLLLVSLVVSAGLSGFGQWAAGALHVPEVVLRVVNLIVSLAVISVLFAMIYRILPDESIRWRDVWIGAVVTAVLFSIGKEAIGLYLGRSRTASIYGAAGSLAVLLVWIYYSAAIVLFGAEFTEVFSRRFGTRRSREQMELVAPEPDAASGP